ncbi:MAG: bifunctional ADP-dependent (S)-NAD(P)H-hydrate dehydratase/NAD(P)H-hydrate epimerase [Gracilibacter sp. BRH_c7a]|nr:MAG: bifunctional ADP-dependent (S)-NAD(P)H-hydrate dehydratase/NAD(P)H-hydrate epimerase [Gracilibacter sp. BRH_c7a]
MRIVSSSQMRSIDANAINNYGIPGIVLMENAALAVVQEIKKILTIEDKKIIKGQKAVILVGKGNNGGDGLAIARHLTVLGMEVTVFLFAGIIELSGDTKLNFELFQKMSGKVISVEDEKQLRLFKLALMQSQIAVDALYGTGFKGSIPENMASYIEDLNKSELPVLCVDIPSGLEADTGKVHNSVVNGDVTVTFGLPKLGHFLGQGPIYTGRLVVDQISIPEYIINEEKIFAYLLNDDVIKPLIPVRHPHGHKGTHGRAVLIGGSIGMSGAVILAGKSAQRCGVGLLQIVVPEGIAETVDLGVIEATVWPAKDYEVLTNGSWKVIEERLAGANACAVGPGLKQTELFLPVLKNILKETEVPIILDADALNLISRELDILNLRKGKGTLILTPHPGEMARLCGCSIEDVQENRLKLAVSKALEWGVIVVLKGAGTIVASPDGRVFLNSTGNEGLGTGGTGDVLTGSILSWLAQGVPPLGAACLGVYLHGKAADILKEQYGSSGYTASEVVECLPKVRRGIDNS